MIDLLSFGKIKLRESKKIADPKNEPKKVKPATRAGFIEIFQRTGRPHIIL